MHVSGLASTKDFSTRESLCLQVWGRDQPARRNCEDGRTRQQRHFAVATEHHDRAGHRAGRIGKDGWQHKSKTLCNCCYCYFAFQSHVRWSGKPTISPDVFLTAAHEKVNYAYFASMSLKQLTHCTKIWQLSRVLAMSISAQ